MNLRRPTLFLLAMVAIIVSACAWQAFGAPVFSDDFVYLVKNRQLTSLSWSETYRLWLGRFNAFEYLPVRDLSYWVDFQLFATGTAGYRAVNLGLYLVSAWLAWEVAAAFVRRHLGMDQDRTWLVAAWTTVLFTVHPSHVESLIWISGRKDLLATVFLLAALLAAMRIRRDNLAKATTAVAGLLVLAIWSKGNSVSALPIIALAIWHQSRHEEWSRRTQLTVLAAVLLPALWATSTFVLYSQVVSTDSAPFPDKAFRAAGIAGWAVRMAVSPEGRQYFYDTQLNGSIYWAHLVGIAGAGAAIYALVLARRSRNPAWILPSLFFLMLAPYLQFVEFRTTGFFSDRFIHLAIFPLALFAAIFATRNKKALLVALAVVFAYTAQFSVRAYEWRDPERMLVMDAATTRHALPALLAASGYRAADRNRIDEILQYIDNREEREHVARLIDLWIATEHPNMSRRELSILVSQLEELIAAVIPKARRPSDLTYRKSVLFISDIWTRLVERYPDSPEVKYNAARWVYKSGDTILARQYFCQAAAQFGENSPHYPVAAERCAMASKNH